MKSKKEIIEITIAHVKDKFRNERSGHDWYHINRVRKMALKIARGEKVNLFVVEMAAILHEMTDRKIVGHGNEEKALQELEAWLTKQGIDSEDIAQIIYIVNNQSYSKSSVEGKKLKSKEGQIVQDADRLEAIGAIGVARCFTYTGNHSRILHDPRIKPRTSMTAEEYKHGDETAINHFYEKLFKLKDMMNTKMGKKIAKERHAIMKDFIKEFILEWEGKR